MPKRFVDLTLFGPWCLAILVWQLGALALARTQPPADLSGKNILIVHSLEGNAPVFVGTDEGFSSTLQFGGVLRLNQYFESLDLRRNPSPGHRKLLVEQMRVRYGRRRIDMIVTMYPEALDFVLKDCRDVFHDVPILALYLPEGIELPKTDLRVIGHSASPDVVGTMEIALKLVPGMKHVYVVSGTHPVDRAIEDRARRDLRRWESRLEFHYVSHMPFEEMLAAVSIMPPGSVVLILAFSQDVAGKSQTTPEVARRLSQVSSGPIFGILDAMLGQGITGGSLISFEYIGEKAGELVLNMLRGDTIPGDIQGFLEVPHVPMFDWRQLRRWRLSEGALPRGSIVINREVTFWDFKYYILGGVAFILLQTFLIAGLLLQRRRKRTAEASLRQKSEELDQFFNVTPDILCIANTDGYFLRLNPSVEAVLGYTREELMTRRFIDFVHPDDVDGTLKALSNLADKQSVFFLENRYRCKSGAFRWLEWSSAPVGKLIYAAARDVTERKLAEQALQERLRFERLVSNISARFVNLPPDRVDSEIERGLEEILELFQVDRCALIQPLPDATSWRVTHAAHSDGVPHEANVDSRTWTEWDVRSSVNIPIPIDGSVTCIISINPVKSERVVPEEFFPQLRLLGEIFVNALERKQIRQEIQERLRFETLISDISAGFVNLALDRIDSEIMKGLRSIAEFFDADRCGIGVFSEDGTRLALAFENTSAEAEPAPDTVYREQVPWYMEQLIQGKPVVVDRVEDLPPEAENELRYFRLKGMKSFLSVPLASGEMNLGACILASTRAERVWPKDLVQRFRLISEVCANALQRKRVEEASRESERMLRQNERDLRGLARKLINAHEEERSRLARELHDDLAQRLAVLAIDVGRLERQLTDPPASVRQELGEMKNGIVRISQDVHSISRRLHPSILDDLGLIKAVESECAGFSRREGIEIAFSHENVPRDIPKELSLPLYRIIQEGLRNISKHACAEHISVSLKGIDHDVLLSVQDDGIGFELAEVKERPGLGFSSMRERATLVNGELSIQSRLGEGTLITLRVPLAGEGE